MYIERITKAMESMFVQRVYVLHTQRMYVLNTQRMYLLNTYSKSPRPPATHTYIQLTRSPPHADDEFMFVEHVHIYSHTNTHTKDIN